MGEVKRYSLCLKSAWGGTMADKRESEAGELVRYADYASLEREHAAAQAELTRLRAVEAAAVNALEKRADLSDAGAGYTAAMNQLAEACGGGKG